MRRGRYILEQLLLMNVLPLMKAIITFSTCTQCVHQQLVIATYFPHVTSGIDFVFAAHFSYAYNRPSIFHVKQFEGKNTER